MMRSNELNSFQLTALSRLFSASVFSEIAKKGQSPMFARSLRETELFDHADTLGITVGEAFNEAFALLRQTGLRNEYVYRSALTHNLLLGKHSLRTACMLNEFRIGSCKADLIILNGTGTVYEIKSERDSLSRLQNQITNYRKAFGKIYVIAGSEHLDDVLKTTESSIGVLSLTRWNRISTIREAEEVLDFICPVTIFESLRINEAKIIASELGIKIPDLPNTQMHGFLKEEFSGLPPVSVYNLMLKTLKKSRSLLSLRELILNLPRSLQPAALSIQLRSKDHERLINTMQLPLNEALLWE